MLELNKVDFFYHGGNKCKYMKNVKSTVEVLTFMLADIISSNSKNIILMMNVFVFNLTYC